MMGQQHRMIRTHRRRCSLLYSLLLLLCTVNQVRSSSAATATAFRAETSILGASAIIDKTTGRIYWEDSHRNTLSASLGPRLRNIVGVVHLRATILSVLLWMAIGGRLVERWHWESQLQAVVLRLQKQQQQQFAATWIQTVLLSCIQTLLHSLPRFCCRSPFLFYLVLLLYALESCQCSTRRYLSSSSTSTTNMESCLAAVRTTDPILTWNVRSFHYANPLQHVLLVPMGVLQRLFSPSRKQQQQQQNSSNNNTTTTSTTSTAPASGAATPSLWRCWKVVTHVASQNYTYTSCVDRTVAGVWKKCPSRSPATTERNATAVPPLTKVRWTQTVLLSTPATRVDYFRQLRAFLRSTQGWDVGTEWSTTITLPSSSSTSSTLRYVQFASSARQGQILHALFWLSTVCGLTVPFRRWLDTRCDQVRVTVVKETASRSSS